MYAFSAEFKYSLTELYYRCSSAFFEEERSALKQKRQKIRLLQQRKVADISQFKDLPEEIPLPLVIGTKVTGSFFKTSETPPKCFAKVLVNHNILSAHS